MLCLPAYTHINADCIRHFAPSERLAVGVRPRALCLAEIFLRRKKIYAGIVGTPRNDWMLKGEEGGITIPLLQYVAQFDGRGDILGFRWRLQRESAVVLPVCRIRVSITCAKRRATVIALLICWRGTSLCIISCVFVPICFSGQSVVVVVEGLEFRPRAVVVGREIVSGCTRISSQENVHEKQPPDGLHAVA